MKKLIEKIIQLRNSNFQFDSAVDMRMIMALLTKTIIMFLRPVKYFIYGRNYLFSFMGKGVTIFNCNKVKLGKWVKIDDGVLLGGLGKGYLEIGERSGIGAYSRVEISQSFNNIGEFIKIGKSVGIGPYASLGGAGGLTIGDECIIGPYLSCHPENHVFSDSSVPIRYQGVTRKGIEIGRNCWIGAKVTILDGVKIGANCVIAAGAVVIKSMPDNVVIGGVPAKIIKEIV